MPPKAPKAPVTCNWVRSNVTDNILADFVKTGYLPKKEVMSYRAPDPSEERPQPKDGEVVIFADHMSRGFALPNVGDIPRGMTRPDLATHQRPGWSLVTHW